MCGAVPMGDRLPVIQSPKQPWPLIVQIVAVWAIASIGFMTVGWVVMFGVWVESLVVLGIGMAVPFGAFFLVGTLTKEGSPLTRTVPWRLLWALLVTVFGLLGAVYYVTAVDGLSGVTSSMYLFVGGVGMPFALVTAMLARGWVVPLVTAAVTVGLIVLGAGAPTPQPPDGPSYRLGTAKLPGWQLLLARPAGYAQPTVTVVDGEAVLQYRANLADVPLTDSPKLVIRVAKDREALLTYQEDPENHVYVRRIGAVEAVAIVSKRATQADVLAFVNSVSAATDAEVMSILPPPEKRDETVLERFTATLRRIVAT